MVVDVKRATGVAIAPAAPFNPNPKAPAALPELARILLIPQGNGIPIKNAMAPTIAIAIKILMPNGR